MNKNDDNIGEENLKKGTKLPDERKVGKTEEEKKKIRFLILLVVAGTVTMFGLTFFAQALSYNGLKPTSNDKGDGKWDIAFTDKEKLKETGNASEINPPSFNNLRATFYVSLNSPGDEIKYSFTITNRGTIDAVLNSINLVPANKEDDIFLFYVDDVHVGDYLNAGQKTKVTVTIKYNEKYKGGIKAKKTAEVIFNYIQR